MIEYLAIYAAASFTGATFFALVGTNNQARLSKSRLLSDPDALIVQAGGLWLPVKWTASRRNKRVLAAIEAQLKDEPGRWKRYQMLCGEMFAWNALETSVAIAFPAAIAVLVGTVISIQ
ncbi:hypothetical protein RCH12_002765 [Cryobacterium sp. MP_3.1]|uniref:hypothetical protein n=1 Tax=Cryobacterium sp. MP_3.1 TaxID=3071711 RepID=UPI002E00B811|nr:hypothetical protein [Cryobacterium sp. MP_3.1]